MVEAYRFHKKQLQLILLARGTDFIEKRQQLFLKEAMHSAHLDAILEVYPDARFIHTFRNPCATVASLCSLKEWTLRMYGCKIDKSTLEKIGQIFLRNPLFQSGNELVKFRKKNKEEESRFIDINYEDLVASPIEAVRRVYGHFGMTLSDQALEKMNAYQRENPQNKYGRHKYNLARYGLGEDEVLEYFKEYIDYFDASRW
ncbi:uncharacterized protein LOC106163697 [Lingula anatina]|uniref:Uncharacterized protein LOC106163697 n=1 Tax=Lingula anatina TaxID=7574 RepID=A0A1S3IEX4_LINAN|nr:uncharacterized protein LOC106163697 [Lingula anatina]|eukprot:XP_013396815.1 uncharacterized protein LOC106163697 [Lingula anatina]